MTTARLGVLGDLIEDIVVWATETRQDATDTESVIRRTRGGSAANVAAFAAPTIPTRFIGCVGEDALGDSLRMDLARAGVEVHLQVRGVTGSIVVVVDSLTAERSMFPHRGAAQMLTEVGGDALSGLTHLHVPAYSFDGGSTPDAALGALRRVAAQGGTTSLDASSTGMLKRFGVERFIALVNGRLRPNLLFANRDEAQLLGLSDRVNESPLPATTVVLKNGPDPTVVLTPAGERVVVPVPPVRDIKDLTGAGDAFAAGFLSAWLKGGNWEQALVQAHATAAPVLRTAGASTDGRVLTR